ncbi:MAG: indolepyruvate ferredoxin oxidoreductase family protein, partial [Pseudomonadales bacterium]|nr:indolepyruvate ferredoxin oxidoreductase family protein [Pseudomonadales bacterium]
QTKRTPHYCSGCPHSQSTRVPEGSRALGGIGCHYMGIWETGNRRAETFTHMGGEGATWIGQAPFTETPHVFQNLGDGTYFHSGLLAIRQTLAAGVNITYKILYNDAVAMTGGQPVDGMLSIAQLIQQLRGEGVKRIALVSDNPDQHRHIEYFSGYSLHHRDELLTLETELREVPGTSVLIYEQTCAAEKRRRRKQGILEDPQLRVVINPEVCEGCGDCNDESNCLSVGPLHTELGVKRQIDQSACNKDYSCLRGYCPSFVTVTGAELKKSGTSLQQANLPALPTPQLAPTDEQPWNVIVTGVGGTGVLTIASIMAMAAHLEGLGCATMNQTGLAQKFGAVVSHVRIGKTQDAIKAVRIAAGDAHLLLGCDLMVAASDETIVKLNSRHSHAIVNDYVAPGSDTLANPDAKVPVDALKKLIESEAKPGAAEFVKATALAVGLLNDSIASNMFMLGYAYQRGLVPVSAEAICNAIRLNNVAVDFNLDAFTWGRHAACHPDIVTAAAKLPAPFEPITDLPALIDDRSERLGIYQNTAYAKRYRDRIEQLTAVEKALGLAPELPLTMTAARSLYKLMAYTDEYEVARLHSDGKFAAAIESQFEPGARVSYHMAPPFLSRKDSNGRHRKLRFPGGINLLLKWLARLRFLRGTAFDLFGYQTDRKEERQLITEFETQLDQIIASLNQDNFETALELVALPDKIRGYGIVKSNAIAATRKRQQTLLLKFLGQVPQALDLEEKAA